MRLAILLFVVMGVWGKGDAPRGGTVGTWRAGMDGAWRAGVDPVERAGVRKFSAGELADYMAHCDHPLVVSFWATYCTPCLKEIPYLKREVEKYRAEGVELLLVSLDRPDFYPGRIADFALKAGYMEADARDGIGRWRAGDGSKDSVAGAKRAGDGSKDSAARATKAGNMDSAVLTGDTDSRSQVSLAWLSERDSARCSAIDKHWSGGLPSTLFINNKTQCRRFYDRQLTDLQVGPAIRALLAPSPQQ